MVIDLCRAIYRRDDKAVSLTYRYEGTVLR